MDSLEELRAVIEHSLPQGQARVPHVLAIGDTDVIRRAGLTTDALGVVGQAYTRAVGRIVDAEVELILAILHQTPEDEREDRLRALIRESQPVRRRTFGLLHGELLREALLERLPSLALDEPHSEPAAVAHVDVMGSTAWLAKASEADTERLVDGLFAAAQSAVHDRPVGATKYVGDGVFLVGRDPAEVADAALSCIDTLAQEPGLPSRAGLAYGPVVRRAGDFFGLTVNLSHALTKAAPAGEVLASAAAAAELGDGRVVDSAAIEVPGFEEPIATAVILRP